MVLYGFLEISETVIGVAKITVRFSFSCPVSHFFRNFEMTFMVIYGFEVYFKAVYGVLEIFIHLFTTSSLVLTHRIR